ncbi:MAG TPA: hypothetical protein VNU68_32915 [Verrucomicrobiae bacterium]|nr:hypothetical protein [Verrucomicrobiae bacterium]
MLIGLKPVHRISDFVRELKKEGSAWIAQVPGEQFHWQDGYSAPACPRSLLAPFQGAT